MLTPDVRSGAGALGSSAVVARVLCSCCSSSDDSERNSLHGSISSGRALASAAERLSCDRSMAIGQKTRVNLGCAAHMILHGPKRQSLWRSLFAVTTGRPGMTPRRSGCAYRPCPFQRRAQHFTQSTRSISPSMNSRASTGYIYCRAMPLRETLLVGFLAGVLCWTGPAWRATLALVRRERARRRTRARLYALVRS